MKWWCRIHLEISADNTDSAFDEMNRMVPDLVQGIADKLGVRARDVTIEHRLTIPYMERDDVDKQI